MMTQRNGDGLTEGQFKVLIYCDKVLQAEARLDVVRELEKAFPETFAWKHPRPKGRNADGLTESQAKMVRFMWRYVSDSVYRGYARELFPATFGEPEHRFRRNYKEGCREPRDNEWFEGENGEPTLFHASGFGNPGPRWILERYEKDGE